MLANFALGDEVEGKVRIIPCSRNIPLSMSRIQGDRCIFVDQPTNPLESKTVSITLTGRSVDRHKPFAPSNALYKHGLHKELHSLRVE